jgi:hypothetical protein
MGAIKKNKCRHCRKLFIPDPRNAERQDYCFELECRKASKRASQRRWLKKPENRNYFRSQENVMRVQEWRKRRPGYWKKSKDALQDPLNLQPTVNTDDIDQFVHSALQDSLIAQPAVFVGLIANITGFALQDDIAKTLLRLQQLGQDILNPSTHTKGDLHDIKTPYFTKPPKTSAQAVQLGRSPAGP